MGISCDCIGRQCRCLFDPDSMVVPLCHAFSNAIDAPRHHFDSRYRLTVKGATRWLDLDFLIYNHRSLPNLR